MLSPTSRSQPFLWLSACAATLPRSRNCLRTAILLRGRDAPSGVTLLRGRDMPAEPATSLRAGSLNVLRGRWAAVVWERLWAIAA
jgi:hypothetical protein